MQTHKPKTVKVLGFFLFLTFFNYLFAFDTIILKFLDLWDFSPLAGANVEYNNQIFISDNLGEVKLSVEKSDSLNLFINLKDYYPQQIQIIPKVTQKIIYLQPLEQAANIQITADRPNKMNIDLAGPNSIIRASSLNIGTTENIATLLDKSTGIFVKNYGAGNALKTISMRGFGAEHTAFTYDGININNQQLGSTELSLLNLQNVSLIELYRGGNSSLFGSGAIAGAVNFVPSLPTSDFQYVLSNSYGSWNTVQNAFMTNFSIEGLRHRINLTHEKSDNDYAFTFKDKTYSRENSDQKYFQVGYSLYHQPADLLAEIIFSNNNRGVAKQILDQVRVDDFARQKDNSIFTRMKWNPFSQTEMQIYWIQQENIYDDPGLLINNEKLHSEHINDVVGLQSSNGLILFDLLRSMTKFEIEKSYIKSTDAGKQNRLRTALSSILEGSIIKIDSVELKLAGSVRWENYSETGNTFLPKLGLTVSNNYFNFYSSYGYNFRIPTFNELYWQPGGNPDLQPEESNSFECGMSYSGNFIWQFTINMDYYRNEIENMIRWLPDNQSSYWRPVNISTVKGEGVELGMNYRLFWDFLYINGNYSYSRTIKSKTEFEGDNTVGNQVPFIPREMGNLGLKLKGKSWLCSLTWSRTGFRYLSFANPEDQFLPSHSLLDLEFGYDFDVFNQYCGVNLQLRNLLNKDYQVMYGYPMPGRNFKLSLTIHN